MWKKLNLIDETYRSTATLNSTINIIIKTHNPCNAACTYCSIDRSLYYKRMSYETLEQIIKSFLSSKVFKTVNFIWHGGEPLMRGKKFYEEVIRLQKLYGANSKVKAINSMQTNALLLNEMMDFLLENDFHLGFSLDGPKEINDSVRLVKNGTSYYDQMIDAVHRMQDRGKAVGACLVLSQANVYKAKEIYNAFKSERLGMSVIPLNKVGEAKYNYDDLGITPDEYAQFMIELFDLWFYDEDQPTIPIQPLEDHVSRILKLPYQSGKCVWYKHCHQSFLGIAPDGGLFPCCEFMDLPGFCYGNIHGLHPDDLPQTRLWQTIHEREKIVMQKCSQCDFYDVCYSGCMCHSARYGDFFEKDFYCEGYKKLYTHITDALHSSLKQLSTHLESRDKRLEPYHSYNDEEGGVTFIQR